MLWVPIAQAPFAISSISLNTEPGAETLVARSVEELLRATDPDVMLRSTTTLAAQVAGKTSRERLLLRLASGFALVALLLAGVGVYGTLAYMVRRRTREIGIRLAFGAGRQLVLRMVAEVNTSPSFSFQKPKVLFKQASAVPDRLTYVSADGERFLALPPARGPQLQQITIFDRKGEVLQKVGDPGLYGGPAFSPDGTRLLVSKTDQQKGQADLWIIELASGKAMASSSPRTWRAS